MLHNARDPKCEGNKDDASNDGGQWHKPREYHVVTQMPLESLSASQGARVITFVERKVINIFVYCMAAYNAPSPAHQASDATKAK